MAYNKIFRKKIVRVSEGLIGSFTDYVLFSIFYGLSMNPGKTSYTGNPQASQSADNLLTNINYQSIKRTIYDLKRKGFLKYAKREALTKGIITEEGRKRINNLIPVYNETRTWDKRLYLISYDIPANKSSKRNQLRDFLRQLGGGYLQHSVWFTPYNPKTLIKEFINEHNIPGQILVSDLGPDGSIGDKDIKTLKEKQQLIFSFLSILKQDPQLPFELLPDYWLGDEVYLLYKSLL